jgi:hypothetical protein
MSGVLGRCFVWFKLNSLKGPKVDEVYWGVVTLVCIDCCRLQCEKHLLSMHCVRCHLQPSSYVAHNSPGGFIVQQSRTLFLWSLLQPECQAGRITLLLLHAEDVWEVSGKKALCRSCLRANMYTHNVILTCFTAAALVLRRCATMLWL